MVNEEELTSKYEEYERLRQAYLFIEAQISKLNQDLDEAENAIKELENLPEGKKIYMMVGNVLVEKDKKEVLDRLSEEKEVFRIKIDSLKKQSESYKGKLTALTKELEDIIKRDNLEKK
ncbi:prefoldin subunit beta [Nanobdella aerobiophila]|uniref:Prefoldin subunit beta n=1 Tax=Nanobdella aerobiophila TaxID=2586965 RepID=A0A915WT26_9ARCH|nr:prefoldin subunit [Nanobdella aerobiophila]BBL45792.1 prefoldin subunit beta [Nanobdella aerobiophila]